MVGNKKSGRWGVGNPGNKGNPKGQTTRGYKHETRPAHVEPTHERLIFVCPLCHGARPTDPVRVKRDGTVAKGVLDSLSMPPPDHLAVLRTIGGYGGIRTVRTYAPDDPDPQVQEFRAAVEAKLRRLQDAYGGDAD